MSIARPRFHKPKEADEKITYETVLDTAGKSTAFITRVKPFPYDFAVMQYIKRYENGLVNGVHVKLSSADSQRMLEITFSPTSDIETCDHEFRNTLVKVSGTTLTSFDRETILRSYLNFLKSCGVKSELDARVHKTPGMDHGSDY